MIAENYQRVLEHIALAARSAGRNPDEITLVVVTKGHPLTTVEEAIAAGARHLGENYAEEGISKITALVGQSDLQWHMIGHVQSRKAQLVAAHYDLVHSVDSLKLAQRLDRFAGQSHHDQGKCPLPVLLEFNVSGETSKSGWPAWDENNWASLLPDLADLVALPHLQVGGLMTMAPFLDDPWQARPYFQRLRQLQKYLAQQLPQAQWDQLSMGMSADYEVAVQEGATLVRVGTAILGSRPLPA
jgi:pyridoxal phosphate enzyme (YggS family)